VKTQKEHFAKEELSIRDMVTEDLSQVLLIERNAQISPWGRLSFEESLTKQYICRALETQGEIIAYHVVCPIADELHILNVVAAPKLQGLGLGHRLMHDILEIADTRALKKIFLEVRASNTIAQKLYLQWQFKQISIRKAYYRVSERTNSKREDALVFMRMV